MELKMKYIVIDRNNVEKIICFSETENHKDVAKRFNDYKIISAGFIRFDDCIADDFKMYCYGESMTLGISSRSKDTDLLKMELR